MEQKLNIAEILKDKPVELKLYSSTFGYIKFNCVHKNKVYFSSEDTNVHSVKSNGKMYDSGECIIFPSKEMRDWNKFSWKKGDVLTNSSGFQIFFDKWANEDYTKFLGKIKLLGDSHCYDTANYSLASKEEALEFIKSVEEINNGKLNRETLEVEKAQPEFKDGDIVIQSVLKGVNICIIKNCIDKIDNKYSYYARYNTQDKEINYDGWSYIFPFAKFATDSEKQQLFSSLEKEGKYWDAEKKQIVNLKSKVRFKPFDKVVVFDELAKKWECGMFSHYSKNYEGKEVITCIGGCTYFKVLPFNEETAKLLGMTDEWKG